MKDIIILILLIILYIAPARTWSIGLIKVDSQFVPEYKLINLYLGILLMTFIFILSFYRNKKYQLKKVGLVSIEDIVLFLYFLSILICLFVYGHSYFYDEFIKLVSVVLIYKIINQLLLTEKYNVLYKAILWSFVILILASFFSINYGGFQEQQRAGTIGFGINETAMIASILLCHSLFKRNHSIFDVVFVIISIGSIAYTASRRGIIFSAICISVFLISECLNLLKLNKLKGKNIEDHKLSLSRAAFDILIILLLLIPISLVAENNLVNDVRLNDIPVMKRILDLEKRDILLYDINRIYIFEDSIEFIRANILWGALGSDLYLTNNVYYNNIHSHNIFVQLLARFGIIVFVVVFSLILNKLYTIIKLMKKHALIKEEHVPLLTLSVQGFIFSLIFEQSGYGLWQMKNLWLFLVFFVIIDERIFCQNAYRRKEVK